jgi:hypothetical protein
VWLHSKTGIFCTLAGAAIGILAFTLSKLRFNDHFNDHFLTAPIAIGYGNLFYLAWSAALKSEVNSYGPPPLSKMAQKFFELNEFDIDCACTMKVAWTPGSCSSRMRSRPAEL